MIWFGHFIERLVGIGGALIFSQFPLFILQYTHQMAGHVAELQKQLAAMTRVAMQGGKTLESFIQKFVQSQDVDFHAQGLLMQEMVERFSKLKSGLSTLQQSQIWERPFYFLKNWDGGVIQDTLRSYEPGFTLNMEGIIYALVGFLVAMGLVRLLRAGLVKLFRREKQMESKHG